MDQPECLLKHITQQNENPATRNTKLQIIGFRSFNSVYHKQSTDMIILIAVPMEVLVSISNNVFMSTHKTSGLKGYLLSISTASKTSLVTVSN